MNTHILFLHALSPLHPGTGQGVGSIDLPIARERSTGNKLLRIPSHEKFHSSSAIELAWDS